MNKGIFNTDPFIGCPFDCSELKIVERHENFKNGDNVSFEGLNKIGTSEKQIVTGELFAIGVDAKYGNGDKFVAVIVKVGNKGHLKTITELTKL